MRKLLIFIFAVFLVTACGNNDSNLTEQIEESIEYKDRYTKIESLKNGYSNMYIYSYPINNISELGEYYSIDNDIIITENKDLIRRGYKYTTNNKETYVFFPESISSTKGIIITNRDTYLQIWPSGYEGDNVEGELINYIDIYDNNRKVIKYSNKQESIDFIFYATTLGVKCEVVIKEESSFDYIGFLLSCDNNIFESINDEYIVIKRGDEIKEILFAPFSKDHKNYFRIHKHKIRIASDNMLEYIIKLDNNNNNDIEYPIKLDTTFYLYQTKQPDSSIKSQINGNQYLSNYLFVGNCEERGGMVSYIRLESALLQKIDYRKIEKAEYIVTELTESSNDSIVVAMRVKSDWGSPIVMWDNQPNIDNSIVYYSKKEGNKYIFDITDLVIKWCKCYSGILGKEYNNRYGFVLKEISGTQNNYKIFSSADNIVSSPYLKITYKNN